MEYSRLGNVIKGQERAVAKSKYEEDIHVNNHSVSWHGTVGQWSYIHVNLFYCKAQKAANTTTGIFFPTLVDY